MENPHPLAVLALAATLGCSLGAAPAAVPAEGDPVAAPTAGEFDHGHALWSRVLGAHVRDGGFDYAALKEDRDEFDAYLALLHAVTPGELAGWSREQRYAFWINVYNAHTVQRVVDDYPLKSIRALDRNLGITTVFEQAFIPMPALHPAGDGEPLSLNDVEHEILRKRFPDARVHAAINCAAASCPPLRAEAYVADRLDAQLDEQMRAFVRDHRLNRLDKKRDRLRLSEIFKWFAEDFERDAGSIRGYLKRWLPEEEHAFVDEARLEYLDYDWALNAAPAAR